MGDGDLTIILLMLSSSVDCFQFHSITGLVKRDTGMVYGFVAQQILILEPQSFHLNNRITAIKESLWKKQFDQYLS